AVEHSVVEVGVFEERPAEAGSGGERGAGKPALHQLGAVEASRPQLNGKQTLDHHRSLEVSAAQLAGAEIDPHQVRAFKVRVVETNTAQLGGLSASPRLNLRRSTSSRVSSNGRSEAMRQRTSSAARTS